VFALSGTGNGLRQALHAVHTHPGQACAWHAVALAAAAAAATAPQHSAAAAGLTARSRALLHMTSISNSSNNSSSNSAEVQQLVQTAQAAAAAGDTTAAIAGYRAALALSPELPALWCELSAAYEAAHKPAAAVAAIESGLRAVGWRDNSSEASSADAGSSDNSSDASTRSETALHLQLALLWQRLSNTERAVQCANRACASGRGAPACEFVRAALLQQQQQQQQQGDGGVCKAAVEGFKRAAAASSSTSSSSGVKSTETLPVPAELLQLYYSGSEQ
jgi:tetratricopeptide (TPR) repeat protein